MNKVEKLEKQVALLERQVEYLFGMVDTAGDMMAAQARAADAIRDTLAEFVETHPGMANQLIGAESLARTLAQIPANNAPKGAARPTAPYRRGKIQFLKQVASSAPPLRPIGERGHREPPELAG